MSQPPDSTMAAQKQPKALVFDIGGVCVASPFQAILDYERSKGIPPGWVNHSISKSAPDGWWHRLERGAIPMDAAFFAGFNADLRDAARWRAFYAAARARSVGTAAEELPADVPPVPDVDGERLFHEMQKAADVPDPWMVPALQALRADGRYVLAALSNTVVFPPGHALHAADFFDHPVRGLFDVFVSSAHVGLRKPEPAMYALAVREVNRFAEAQRDTPRGRANGWGAAAPIAPGDMLFLDDIGENLKAARQMGFRTLKVHLGRAYEAVDTLEAVTGLSLAGTHPRPPAADGQQPKAHI